MMLEVVLSVFALLVATFLVADVILYMFCNAFGFGSCNRTQGSTWLKYCERIRHCKGAGNKAQQGVKHVRTESNTVNFCISKQPN